MKVLIKLYLLSSMLLISTPTMAECPCILPKDYRDIEESIVVNCLTSLKNKNSIDELEWNLIGGLYYSLPDTKEWNVPNKINNIKWECSGKLLSEIASRKSILSIIKAISLEPTKEHSYIRKWFATALKNNPYETIIALRQIYKKDMYFYDKDAEKILKDICQEAMDKY